MRFAIAANRTSIDPAGLKFDLSDFDGYAVEVALRLVEKQPPGEVVVVTLGPDAAQETLRKALSMGVDRGVHLAAAEVPFDGLAIARAHAAELRDGGYELMLLGRMATECGTGHHRPAIAEVLGV